MLRIFQSKIVTGLLVLVIAWLGLAAVRINKEKQETAEQVANIEAKIAALQEENAHLEKLLVYLKNPEFLARQVRAKLNYKSAGEDVAYVYLEEKKSAAVEASQEKEPSFLEKTKNWFYNLFR